MNNENRNVNYTVVEELFITLDNLLTRRSAQKEQERATHPVQQERPVERGVQTGQMLKPRLGR